MFVMMCSALLLISAGIYGESDSPGNPFNVAIGDAGSYVVAEHVPVSGNPDAHCEHPVLCGRQWVHHVRFPHPSLTLNFISFSHCGVI